MAESDLQSATGQPLEESLVSLPYALYCLDGGMWGLIQGGDPRVILPIRWQRLATNAEVCVPAQGADEKQGSDESNKDHLYAAILRVCHEFGYTNDCTYDCIQKVVESISLEPFD